MKQWLLTCVLVMLSGWAAANTADPVQVDARTENDHIVLTVHFTAPVSADTAWGVLTDFEHMTSFLPYLKESKVLFRNANFMRVQQKGTVPVAFFQIAYNSIRDVEMLPAYEIHSSTSGGDAGLTRSVSKLVPGGSQKTELNYHADWWPSSQMIAGFGLNSMRDLLTQQFTAMRQEMLRRQQLQK